MYRPIRVLYKNKIKNFRVFQSQVMGVYSVFVGLSHSFASSLRTTWRVKTPAASFQSFMCREKKAWPTLFIHVSSCSIALKLQPIYTAHVVYLTKGHTAIPYEVIRQFWSQSYTALTAVVYIFHYRQIVTSKEKGFMCCNVQLEYMDGFCR